MTFPPAEISLEPATPADLPALFALYDEAARWLTAAGIAQWPVPFPVHFLTSAIARGAQFVRRENGEIAAALSLRDSDPKFWGDAGKDGSALYVHRLVVARAHAGNNLGGDLLAWVERRTAQVGKRALRLDCWAGNARLRQYYQDAGFTCRGEREVEETGRIYTACLFEKQVG